LVSIQKDVGVESNSLKKLVLRPVNQPLLVVLILDDVSQFEYGGVSEGDHKLMWVILDQLW
jgi:hypothetical protein